MLDKSCGAYSRGAPGQGYGQPGWRFSYSNCDGGVMDADVIIPAISGLGGLLLAAASLVHPIRKERRNRAAAEAAAEAAERRRQEDAEAAKDRELAITKAAEQRRREDVSAHYLSSLGDTCAMLDAILVDADNADDLIFAASNSFAKLQGIGQGELFTLFNDSPPVVWLDRACRQLLDMALTLARDARAEGQTGEAARETSRTIQRLTERKLDDLPRELMRWALNEATKRWPQPLVHFEDYRKYQAQRVAEEAGVPLSDALVPEGP
ncbi:hypothetical protein OOK27_50490 [Streptomyces canus]|uniref:hypothetical protein n=1 Tax=Streptomyces canus TaxID=58343 RepID=UPI00225B2907|nr:hypothetical protein [Streptomyces canus]MCX5262267.1 hypothetical protein [Streptomyces canus]